MSTKSLSLNKLLNGGFALKELTLIYGEASTGKTTLVLQTAIEAAKTQWKTIYIDVDLSFTPQRFIQIAGLNKSEASSNIFVFSPRSFLEQTCIIENLENYLSKSFALIIVDSITTLYRLEASTLEERFTLNRALNRQLAYLAELAKKHELTVLLTSQVHSLLNYAGIEPIAKRALLHWCGTIIKLRNLTEGFKEAIIERLNFKEEFNLKCRLKLAREGLIDANRDE
ncbi:MAG: ATPase domain-containing protein [Candidatus Bathyarchaeia archaeon]